jgi:hypothetical protein
MPVERVIVRVSLFARHGRMLLATVGLSFTPARRGERPSDGGRSASHAGDDRLIKMLRALYIQVGSRMHHPPAEQEHKC